MWSLAWSRCGALPPVDSFCVGGHSVEEPGDELGMSAAASGEAELPEFCGGTVIAPTAVATAAHCVIDLPTLDSVEVVTGRQRLSSEEGERIGVTAIHMNPAYSDATARNDVAVLHHDRDFDVIARHTPLKVAPT